MGGVKYPHSIDLVEHVPEHKKSKSILDRLEDTILREYLKNFLIWNTFSKKISNFPSLGVVDPPYQGPDH